jgi:predicted MFS family arabinose efflux permease
VAHILFSFAISYFILKIASASYGEETATLIQSIYLALNGVILLVLTPLGGVLADRWNKVKIMYVTDYIRGFTILATGAFVFFNPTLVGDLIGLFLMNLILSVNAGIFGPASSSLLRFVVKDEELQQASSYLQGSASFQSIIGLILCGLVYANVEMIWIFVINGVAYIISAITEMFIRYEHHPNPERITMKAVLADTRDGLTYLWGEKAIMVVLIMALFLNFFFNPVFSVGLPNFIEFSLSAEPVYLFQSFLSPTAWVAAIEIAFSVTAIILALILSSRPPREKQGRHLKVVLCGNVIPALVIAAAFILYYQGILRVDAVLLMLLGSMMLFGAFNVAFNIPINLIMQRNVDKTMLGKVSSVSNVLSMGLTPLSSLLGGIIIAKASPSALYLFSALGMILTTIWYVTNKKANTI